MNSALTTPTGELGTEIPSPEPLTNLFFARAERAPERVASYSKVDGRWVGTTWREARLAVEECALGLLELGAEKGARVAILAQTRREWPVMDLAVLAIGGVTVGLHPALGGRDARRLLELSGARIVFVDDRAQRVKLREASAGLEPPVTVITLEPRAEEARTVTLDELRRRGAKRRLAHPDELGRRLREVRSGDVASYIYTPGTTGEPKGAMLTHANFHYSAQATNVVVPAEREIAIAFLPLSHSLQRTASYVALVADLELYYAESIDRLCDNLREVRPTCFALFPRLLEKSYLTERAAGPRGLEGRVHARALAVLREIGRLRREGRLPGVRARLAGRAADRLVARPLRERLGGRVRYVASGGAPLARDVHEFFEDVGIPILEGWGLTETAAAACVNRLDNRRIGTVGRPLPGTHIRIAADGEVLVKSPGVFLGYHDDPAATREAFDDDGWFHTGDLGAMSRDGFLTITDRKKDLIVTADGTSIPPQPLEGALKVHPLVGQAVVIGERRPYLTALIGLDPEARVRLAEQHHLTSGTSAASIAALPAVRAEIEAHLARLNERLPSTERIQRFEIIPDDLSIESGLLTPTLKVKRRVVAERYAPLIERLYREAPRGA